MHRRYGCRRRLHDLASGAGIALKAVLLADEIGGGMMMFSGALDKFPIDSILDRCRMVSKYSARLVPYRRLIGR